MSTPARSKSSMSTRQRSATVAQEEDGVHTQVQPRRTKSCFTRLPDGHYVEPFHPNLIDYSAPNSSLGGSLVHSRAKAREKRFARARAREAEISATVVCVRRASQNILIRFMPREEWIQIKRSDEVLSVGDGRCGETSEHVVASPLLRTMPGSASSSTPVPSFSQPRSRSPLPLPMVSLEPTHDDDAEDENITSSSGAQRRSGVGRRGGSTTTTMTTNGQSTFSASRTMGASRSVQHHVPWSCYMSESSRVLDASVSEPLVYDYFVPPENTAASLREAKHNSLAGYVKYKMTYSQKEMQALEKEYRRSYLALERRQIFLWQLQRDLQARLHREPMYVVARVVPEEFMQTFFMLREEQNARVRYDIRRSARDANDAAERIRQIPQHLFVLDHTFSQLPFAGQASSDGYVVVSIGGPTTADTYSLFDNGDSEDEEPFVPHQYGTATYTARSEKSTASQDRHGEMSENTTPDRRADSMTAASLSLASTPGGELSLGSPDALPLGRGSGGGVVPVLMQRTTSASKSTRTRKCVPTTAVPSMGRIDPTTNATLAWALEEDSPLCEGKPDSQAGAPKTPKSRPSVPRPSSQGPLKAALRPVPATPPVRESECSLSDSSAQSRKSQTCV